MPEKLAFLTDFIPVSSSRCLHLFYIQIWERVGGEGGVGCLINKTVAPLFRYSFCRLPPGIYTSQLSALMGRRYLDFDGCIFFWLPCARSSVGEPGRAVCSEMQSCQTCQRKSLIFLAHRTKCAFSIVRDVRTQLHLSFPSKKKRKTKKSPRPHATGDLYG